MARIIEIDIDLKKLNKQKMRVTEKGTYTKIILIETPDGKYGDWMVVEKQSKEERENREKGTILGNGKNFNWGGSKPESENRRRDEVKSDDLPY